MTKYIVFDTETTGLLDYTKPADHPDQPRLAHLAMISVDENLVEEAREDFYIKPDGWTMPQGPKTAGEITGYTDEFLSANGGPVRDALLCYQREIKDGRVMVAFNAQFDLKIMRSEMRRAGIDDLFEQTKNICVMRPMVDVCRLPRGRFGGFKFPKLSEALDYMGVKLEGAHQAMNDAEGALQVMRWLKARDLLPEPGVYFAKEKPEQPTKKTKTTRGVSKNANRKFF